MSRRIALAGTPGTGKTTVASLLADDGGEAEIEVVHLNDAIREHDLWTERDAERDSLVADLDAVAEWLEGRADEAAADADAVIVESHLAHLFAADRVVVLRCRPDLLAERLRDRGEPAEKAAENRESEALGVVLSEAVERHGRDAVHEIDTTERSPEAVAEAVRAVVAGEREPDPGHVDYLEYA